ncbi:PP2C family protein-serine/threonine phosphatase [Maritimibacter sp. DP1N21-5]|uniref:PP2C family protein-serine/threonine phosphatase n=1 Tax=Maritimibacter sp. DP1N21-5 TaxID=2836867 RepID=UPI00351CF1CD
MTVHDLPAPEVPVANAIRRVLVVDDSRAQRRLTASTLARLGFEVIEAATGEDALSIAARTDVDMVLSDWMMPGMDGLELCRRFRSLPRDRYGYFILLTSKNDKGAVAQGLDVGADDFVTKPVNGEELRARIAAGDRILRMERELSEKNRLISATLEEISTLYDSLDRDLIEARKMQQALVRDRVRDFGGVRVSLMLKPAGHVGGDLVGMFDAGAGHAGVYAIDVSGHGVASALLTARLAGYLSQGPGARNLALVEDGDGGYRPRAPAEVAALLNQLMLSEVKSDLYFTMNLALVEIATGRVEVAQCGHPNPAVIEPGGRVRFHGSGGMPIGLMSDASYENWTLTLAPGERLALYSDGFTECRNAQGDELEESGFARMLARNAALLTEDLFEALIWDLDDFASGQALPDDLSCAVIDYRAAGPS